LPDGPISAGNMLNSRIPPSDCDKTRLQSVRTFRNLTACVIEWK
jgi:hypothetical protein